MRHRNDRRYPREFEIGASLARSPPNSATGPPHSITTIRHQKGEKRRRHVGSVHGAPRQSPNDCDRVYVARTSHELSSRSPVPRRRFTFFFLIYPVARAPFFLPPPFFNFTPHATERKTRAGSSSSRENLAEVRRIRRILLHAY